jgi:hypothetical protein
MLYTDVKENTMSDTNADKTSRITINLAPHVRAMLDALCDRSGLDRPAVLAILIQDMVDNPRSPFFERKQEG